MLFLRHEGCAWCYSTRRMFIIMVTFKILVSYFICVATAKTLSVSWHWKTFSTWPPACVADSWVVCYFTVTAAGVFVWSRRTYIARCNFRLQIVWLQFMYIWNTVVIVSEDEDCSLEDILLTKSYTRPLFKTFCWQNHIQDRCFWNCFCTKNTSCIFLEPSLF